MTTPRARSPQKHNASPLRDLLVVVGLGVLTFAAGTAVAWTHPDVPIVRLPQSQRADVLSILLHNGVIALVFAACALATAGLGTAVLLFMNGFSVGLVVSGLASSGQLAVIVTAVLPHAALEVVGLAAAGAVGVAPWVAAARWWQSSSVAVPTLVRAVFGLAACALLLVALGALVEGTLSTRSTA